MRVNFSILLLFLTMNCLGGCASGLSFTELDDRFPQLAPGEGRIFFYRDRSPVGSALRADIRLNDEVVGRSVPGGFFFVDRPAGNYIVATATETDKRLSFSLAANERKYIRTRVSFGVFVGHISPHLESEPEATNTLGKVAYIGDESLLQPVGSP